MRRSPTELNYQFFEGEQLKYLGGDLKLLALVAASVLVVFVFWLSLEKGTDIAGVSKAEPDQGLHRIAVPSGQRPAKRPPRAYSQSQNLPRPAPSQDTNTIYKWVDEKGTVSFSDRPQAPSAEKISIQPVPAYDFPQTPKPSRNNPTAQSPAVRQETIVRIEQVQPVTTTPSFQTRQTARGTFVTSGGNIITAYARHMGPELTFHGRVKGGERCDSLRLTGYLMDNDGRRVRRRVSVENVGGYEPSRLFKSRAVRVSDLKNGWELYRVDAACVGN